MIVKTEALILKSMKYRDTSKIVTLYTRDYGLIRGIAKGARTMKNSFGASLEPLTFSQVVFYRKENRDLYLLSQGTVLRALKNVHSSLLHLTVGFAITEILYRCTKHEEKNEQLFQLLFDTLTVVDTTSDPLKYLYAFQVQYAKHMGYAPSFAQCARCGRMVGNEKQVVFQVIDGTVLCEQCENGSGTLGVTQSSYTLSVPLSYKARSILHTLTTSDVQALQSLSVENDVGNEIEKLLRNYYHYHFGNMRHLNSMILLQQ